MSDINKSLFGPISKDYCLYFYILSVFWIISFAMAVIGVFYTGIKKRLGVEFYAISLIYSVSLVLSYLQNRLLYNMCANSL